MRLGRTVAIVLVVLVAFGLVVAAVAVVAGGGGGVGKVFHIPPTVPHSAGLVSLPPALYAADRPGSVRLVTTIQAAAVAAAMWSLRQAALADGDRAAIRQLDATGGALEASDLAACGCSADNVPLHYSSLVTLVPSQAGYPIDFMAEYQTQTQLQPNFDSDSTYLGPWLVIEVLTKASPRASWRVAFASGFSNAFASANVIPFRLPPGAGPYDDVATIQPPVPVDQLPSLLAAYWQSFKDTGHAPASTPFLDGSDTSEFGDYIAQSPSGIPLPGTDAVATFQYSADPARDGIWSFPVQPGDDLVTCSTIRVVATYRPYQGAVLVQGSHRGFGAGLSPGRYSSIVDTTIHESCILTASNGLAVFGTQGFDTSDRGTKAGP